MRFVLEIRLPRAFFLEQTPFLLGSKFFQTLFLRALMLLRLVALRLSPAAFRFMIVLCFQCNLGLMARRKSAAPGASRPVTGGFNVGKGFAVARAGGRDILRLLALMLSLSLSLRNSAMWPRPMVKSRLPIALARSRATPFRLIARVGSRAAPFRPLRRARQDLIPLKTCPAFFGPISRPPPLLCCRGPRSPLIWSGLI